MHFSIYISPDLYDHDKQQNLIIKVIPDEFGDPDLYISKKEKYPESLETSDWACSTQGKDICTISQHNISTGDTFYIGVRCYKRCNFNLYPTLVPIIILQDGMEYQIHFSALETKLFKLYIPLIHQDVQVKSVTIQAQPVMSLEKEEMMLAVSNKRGVLPNTGAQQKRGINSWTKGQVLRMSSENALTGDWCNECWVVILLDATHQGIYNLMAKTDQGFMQLHSGQKVDEVAYFGDKRVCYKYFIDNQSFDLQVKLVQYSGLIRYCLEPRDLPINYTTCKHRSIEDQPRSILTLSPFDRMPFMTGLYYLCVYPQTTSTFSLLISELSPYRSIDMLYDGFTETLEFVGEATTKYYLYKVPPMEYVGEDIQIEVQMKLIGAGNMPKLKGKMCTEKSDFIVSQEYFQAEISRGGNFIVAKYIGGILSLIIDHDEIFCSNHFAGECYYLFIVESSPLSLIDEIAQFQLSIRHSQLSYHLLQDNQILLDHVIQGQYKYYSFTLLEDTNVSNVTFHMDTLHGDADIYISRSNKKPNKTNFEKSSIKSTSDEIIFSEGKLSGSYYIGVYSFQYSTYNLMVKVTKNSTQQTNQDTRITDGIPILADLQNADNIQYYSFEVKMLPGYEKKLFLSGKAQQGSWLKFYVNVWNKASKNTFLWQSQEGQITIKPSDPGFIPQGTYFVTVLASTSLWMSNNISNYKYTLTYKSEDNYIYMRSQGRIEMKQEAQQISYFRHYIAHQGKDVSITITTYSGEPHLFVSLNPSNKSPDINRHDFASQVSRGQIGGKSVFISRLKFAELNPHCQNNFQEEDSQEPCAIFAAVNCVGTRLCSYTLRLLYEQSLPQALTSGVPYNSVSKSQTFTYFYLQLTDDSNPLQLVLISETGNADMYVILQEGSSQIGERPEILQLPDLINYDMKSIKHEGQDRIQVSTKDIEKCQYISGECIIIIGVYVPDAIADTSIQSPQQQETDIQQTTFTLIAYTNLIHLTPYTPFKDRVENKSFKYYIIEVTCNDCTLLISLSTYSSVSNPDLYLSVGDSNLPTLNKYDFLTSTLTSDTLEISLDNSYFKAHNISSMCGPYIVGVYGGSTNTQSINYTLSYSQDLVRVIEKGNIAKSSQYSYEIKYWMWENRWKGKDVRIKIIVNQGLADLYVGTYYPDDPSSNLVNSLPQSKRDTATLWILENVVPTSSMIKQEILIVNQERNYCYNCNYIIGVVTHELDTQYTLSIDVMDADFANSQLIKFGEVYKSKIAQNTQQIYRFILNDNSDFTILQIVNNGQQVVTSLTFDLNEYHTNLHQLKGNTAFTMKTDNEYFMTDKMYYLILETQDQSEAVISILISQERTIHSLSDGIPMKFKYNSVKDVSKYMMMKLNNGQSSNVTIQVQVKSMNQSFHPRLYLQFHKDIDSQASLEFPPESNTEYNECFNWDYRLQIMICEFTFPYSKNGGLIMNLFDNQMDSRSENDEVYLTVQTSSIMTILSNIIVFGQNNKVYSVDEHLIQQQKGFLKIEFSQCQGQTNLKLTEKSQNSENQTLVHLRQHAFGRLNIFIKLPKQSLFINTLIADNSKQSNSFLLKISQTNKAELDPYQFEIDSSITYEILNEGQQIKLKWSGIKPNSNLIVEQFIIVMSQDQNSKLDSLCAVTHNYTDKYHMFNFFTNKRVYIYDVTPQDNNFVFNVFAQIKTTQGQTDFIPYIPVAINYHPNNGSETYQIAAKFLILIIFVVFSGMILRSRLVKKNENVVSNRDSIEMTSQNNNL